MPTTSNLLSNEQLTRPFVESTQAVFSMMLGSPIEWVADCQCACFDSALDLSGVISYSGAIRGTIVIRLDLNVAFSVTETLLGSRPDSVNGDVRDAVAELANLIAGNAKERLNNAEVSLGLPTVSSSQGVALAADANDELRRLCFTTPWGPIVIEMALRQFQ
jgi:chemotaxis protein CheX